MELSERLEYLRGEIEAGGVSLSEIVELQGYGEAGLIPEGDVLLLEWAGVPEFPEEEGCEYVPESVSGLLDHARSCSECGSLLEEG